MLGDAGYSFVGFAIASGANTLHHALTGHDQKSKKYKVDAARFLRTVDPNDAAVISRYEQAVKMMFG